MPSEVCVQFLPQEDIDYSRYTTETIFGSTYTDRDAAITGTVPGTTTTIRLSTETGSGGNGQDETYASSWGAVDVVDVLYFVYAASDTATASDTASASDTAAASSNETGATSVGTTAKAEMSAVVVMFTVGVAFISGFMMLAL